MSDDIDKITNETSQETKDREDPRKGTGLRSKQST